MEKKQGFPQNPAGFAKVPDPGVFETDEAD
jgi:hypothetical protein